MSLFAILIAISAINVETPSVEGGFEAISSIQQVPFFVSTALSNDSKKNSEKTLHIAQDFISVLLIADALNPNLEFVHYLPLYNLLRQKEYFLLI